MWVEAITGEAFRRISGGEAREISLSDAEGDTDPFTNTWGFRTELCRLYGYLPAAGDRHVCELLPGYLRDERERKRLDLRVTTVDVRRERLAADIVQAGLTGDMDLAFHAFLNDPLVGSGPDARKMFEAQREYLPQF